MQTPVRRHDVNSGCLVSPCPFCIHTAHGTLLLPHKHGKQAQPNYYVHLADQTIQTFYKGLWKSFFMFFMLIHFPVIHTMEPKEVFPHSVSRIKNTTFPDKQWRLSTLKDQGQLKGKGLVSCVCMSIDSKNWWNLSFLQKPALNPTDLYCAYECSWY